MTISTDVPNDEELHRLTELWRKGDRMAAHVLFICLWQLFHVVKARLTKRFGIYSNQTEEAMKWGFDAMIEELDLMLSGGAIFFLENEDPKTGNVRKVPLLTDRPRLGKRNDFRWIGAQSFKGWVTSRWASRAIDKLRGKIQKRGNESIAREVLMADPPLGGIESSQEYVVEIKEGLLQKRQELLRLIGRLSSENENGAEKNKGGMGAQRHLCCALDSYPMQAMWNASPNRKKFVWDENQLTESQQNQLQSMMDAPVASLVSEVDVCGLILVSKQARAFVLSWTKARLAIKNPAELDDMKTVRNTYLDNPVRHLRDELEQIVPWFFDMESCE